MKIFFCFLSSFFLFFSLPANAIQWINGTTASGAFPLNQQINLVNWSAIGSISQVNGLSSNTYNTFNSMVTGCSGVNSYNGWCPVSVKFAKFVFSGGVIQFESNGTLPIGTTGGDKCYITSATSFVGRLGGVGSDLHGTENLYYPQYALNNTGWITVDGACKDLTPSSPSLSGLSVIVPEIEGYIIMLVSGATGNGSYSTISNGDVRIPHLYAFKSTANIKPMTRIIACAQPQYNTASCNSSYYVTSPLGVSPNVPDVSCNVNVPKEITISDVSTSDFIGKKGTDTIYAQCSLPVTLSFQILNDGIVNVGPFNVTTLIDNQSSPKIEIPENGKNINISAEIKGNSKTVEAGSYENTVIIITSIS